VRDLISPRAGAYAPAVRARGCTIGVCLALAVALGRLLLPAPAGAAIAPASVLDGPANDILEVDGSAMARDGTGGIVYRKDVGGVAHVFAVPFANGRWGAPVEVDPEDAYGAGQPAIAAGEDGRLLVVWVQARNLGERSVTLYELMGASLQPGASTFGRAIIIDPNVGAPYTGDINGVDPSLAMAPDGAAYVVYRTIVNDCKHLGGDPPVSSCPPQGASGEVVDVRVARFDYLLWSSPATVNRAPQVAMREPTSENAPAIGIALDGNGVVAWQEPENSAGPARIWARRLFGTVLGNVLQASPETIGGAPVTSDADGVALAVGPFGEAQIAYRVHGAAGSAVRVTQLFLNSLLSEVAPHGAQLQNAVAVAGAAQGVLGAPSAAIDQREDFRIAWTQGGSVRDLAGAPRTASTQTAVGSAVGQALTTINPAGGGTTAWLAPPGSPPAVHAREDFPQGAFQTVQLAGTLAGTIAGLALGGDGQGDALLAFAQGPPGDSEVLGSFVQAPPAPFVVDTPAGWVRGAAATITWETPFDAVAGITYTVYVDGRPRIGRLTQLSARLAPGGLGNGVHKVQVLATDAAGEQTMSPSSTLKVDASPPIVRVRPFDGHRGVRIAVTDNASGVDVHATVISFGDGYTTRHRKTAVHRYAHAGVYWITARVRDRLGVHATVHLRVRVL
jgi:hypothetical protein